MDDVEQMMVVLGVNLDENHKKPLPKYPETIGVVTSSTGAALQDIINIAKRRNPKVNIIVFPAIVQGAECAENCTF